MSPCHVRASSWIVLGVCSAAAAQTCTPEWSDTFAVPPVINGEVRGLAFFDDGRGRMLYAGGTFDRAGGQVVRGMMRWEGDRWTEFGGGVQPVVPSLQNGVGVYWVGTLDTGSGPGLYIAGTFDSAGGVPAKNVARWTGAGWAAMGAGLNDNVRAMAAFNDGAGTAIYATGKFVASGSAPMYGVAKWNGSAWQPMGGGLSGNFAWGYSLSVMDLGQGPRLVVTGQFTHAGGVPAVSVAAWDGQAWAAAAPPLHGVAPAVFRPMFFDYGTGSQLTVAGNFSLAAGGQRAPRVARWAAQGWVQVGADLGSGEGEYVSSLAAIDGPEGRSLYAGGPFHTATWLNRVNYIARLQAGEWAAVDGGMRGGSEPFYLRCLLPAVEGGQQVLYASGGFAVAGDAMASRVARWDGTRWSSLEHLGGMSSDPRATSPYSPPYAPYGSVAALYNDGFGDDLFVGGEFLAAGERVCNSIAAWHGQVWRTLGGGLTLGGDDPGRVLALCPFDDGSGTALYAAGQFDNAGGGPCFSIARWNGTDWSAPGGNGILRNNGAGVAVGYGHALAALDDGSGPALYIGGQFDFAAGLPAGGIARWDGAAWSAVGTGTGVPKSYAIRSLAVFDEGKGPVLFAGGDFSSIDGIAAASIARWDGSVWSPVGDGFPSPSGSITSVMDLAVFDDGAGAALFAAGNLGVPSGGPLPLLARWDGSAWHSIPMKMNGAPIEGGLRTMTRFDDGSGAALYVGGPLRATGAGNVGMLRLRQSVWEVPGAGVSYSPFPSNTEVLSLAVRRDGDHDVLLVTGRLDRSGGKAAVGIAEWHGCAPCYPDCDGDTLLTLADFGCFQTKFGLGDMYADCDGDSLLTLADFGCFQTAFAVGCP